MEEKGRGVLWVDSGDGVPIGEGHEKGQNHVDSGVGDGDSILDFCL